MNSENSFSLHHSPHEHYNQNIRLLRTQIPSNFSLYTGYETVFVHEKLSFMESWSPKLGRGFLTLTWTQPVPCTWESSAPCGCGQHVFGRDISFAVCQRLGDLVCEFLGGEDHTLGVHTQLWPTQGTPGPSSGYNHKHQPPPE